ncbi:MAG: chorismate mutase [Planctomycetes bacterium]|nr:chorismate mutase [Planctomycetota bacterium]
MSLEEARLKINALDDEIVRLLDRRIEAAREAATAKIGLGLPLRDATREEEVIARLTKRRSGMFTRRSLENIYRTIMAETLALEKMAACPTPTGTANGKRDIKAEIIESAKVAPGFFRMRIAAPELSDAFQPGQFFQIRIGVEGDAPFLRRPFAPSETGPDGFAFIYAVVGGGTERLASLRPGTQVRVLAPLGNAYTLLFSPSSALIIGGGCGVPSLAPLAERLKANGVLVTALIAARSSQVLLEREAWDKRAANLILATDDGSFGRQGTAIDALREEVAELGKFDRIYVCGPLPLLKATATMAEESGVDCEVSLEERMACGFGACIGCAVPVKDEKNGGGFLYQRVCHEGPVFNSRALAWERMRS